ncbi:MAG: Asp-tRNA(Asn)/Glu-tRNA(Gln) amidotransferase subunit GatC [Calditrichaeota bacterium]|nr:MAG: Asp-tRNA(Asn)/Glu-tRNA(Gln) amidotransferase subunit GatC [Calditrichota bacterium]
MAITVHEVDKITFLAKLKFSESEKQKIARELDQIVAYVDKLNELDTSDVEPLSHVMEFKNVLREDSVEKWLTQEEALKNAPAKKQGYFSVPKVIGN